VEVHVGPAGDIAEGGVKIVQAGSLFLGVYRIGGSFYALEDVEACPVEVRDGEVYVQV